MGRSKIEKSQETALDDLLELGSEAVREACLGPVDVNKSTLRGRFPNAHDVMGFYPYERRFLISGRRRSL